MLKQQQYHRRIFRGRGGATDRRLPKHNAARRRPPSEQHQPQQHHLATNDAVDDDENWEDEQDDTGEEYALEILPVEQQDTGIDTTTETDVVGPADDDPVGDNVAAAATTTSSTATTASTRSEQAEIEHLRRRIRNNRTAMSLSSVALTNPSSYQSNVLAACLNTAKEWRSIVKHYPTMDDDVKKNTALSMFELIQQSLQCGPLAGAKPGYFKRCGGEMAGIVHAYLMELAPAADGDNATEHTLCFTATQAQAIERWKQDSHKATINGKAPSKSAVKALQKARKK